MKIDKHMVTTLVILVLSIIVVFIKGETNILYFTSLVLGLLSISVVSEYAVKGIKSLAIRLGVSDYVGGVFSSLASNLPEAVLALFMASRPELREIAILMILLAAAFNGILLGILIVILSKKSGYVEMPKEALIHDIEVMRITIVFTLLIASIGIVLDIHGGENILPYEVPPLMLLAYLSYIYFLSKSGKRLGEKVTVEKHWILYFIIGIVGIVLGSELISSGLEHFVRVESLSLGIVATLLAFAGSVPEHFIAVLGGIKGEVDIGVSNLLSGIVQSLMFILPLVALFVPVYLDGYVIYQLIANALTLWLVKKSIVDDGKLTLDEGVSIILAHLLGLLLFDELSIHI